MENNKDDKPLRIRRPAATDKGRAVEATQNPNLMDINRLSKYLDIKVSTLRAWVSTRQIPFFKLGNLVRFRRSEIDAWIESQRQQPR